MDIKWMKRISFFLALVMLLTMLPVAALAETIEPASQPAETQSAEEYTVALTATDGGRVSGGGAYAEGEEVTASAHPADGYQFDGWYDGGRLVSLAPVYTFAAAETVSYQAAFTAAEGVERKLTVTCDAAYTSSVTLTDGKADLDLGTSVTLTFTDENKTFLYWVNDKGSILSTAKEYTFILAADTAITAKYAEKDTDNVRVVFRNAYAQIVADDNYSKSAESITVAQPTAPARMGHTFEGWYLAGADGKITDNLATNEAILAAIQNGAPVVVLPKYTPNGATYTVTVTYENVTHDPETYGPIPVGEKQNIRAPEEIEGQSFRCWKLDGKVVVGYDVVYSALRAQSGTVALTAVYGDAVTPEPIVNITQTYAAVSGEKYVISNTMQYYVPLENAQVIETGFVYGTSPSRFSNNQAEENLIIGGEKTYRSVSGATSIRGIYTFNGRLSKPDTTLYIRAYVTYKVDEEILTKYSSVVSGSYYTFGNVASVKEEDNGGKTTTATVVVTQRQTDTVAATATVPQGVKLANDVAVSNGTVALTVTTEKTVDTNPNKITMENQETANYDVSIIGVSSENETPIVVCLQKALPLGLVSVSAYHSGVSMGYRNTANLTEKDTYYYDPATGDVYICVTHFSNFTFGFVKATAVVDTTPAAISGLTYNGEAQALVTAGTATGGTMQYKLGDGQWNDSVPTATAAGNYTVYYKVVGDANHNDSAAESVDVTIAKASITPAVTLSDWTYGEVANTPAVTGNTGNGAVTYYYKAQGADDSTYTDTVPTAAGTYTVKAVIAETANYNNAESTTNFTITKAPATFSHSEAFINVDKYLYRVGNRNEVHLGNLFAVVNNGGAPVVSADVTVTATPADNDIEVSGTYTPHASDWTQSTLQFTGEGPVRVTIREGSGTEYTLNLEVVDATNATSAMSATSANIVLLNDVSGTFTVSNNHTFYGNGFTVTAAGKGRSKVLSESMIRLEDGTIDNVIIKCDFFPEAYMFKDQVTFDSDKYADYLRSAVGVYGNGTIANSYIEGARAAVYVGADKKEVNIINTTLFGGSLCNLLVASVDNLVLNDVTTIQTPVKATYKNANDEDVTTLGLGVFSSSEKINPKITLRGDLKQFNWVSEKDKEFVPTAYEGAITASLNQKQFVHTINDTNYVNLGIIYSSTSDATIIDERKNKNEVPYEISDISFNVAFVQVKGKVCSYANSAGCAGEDRVNFSNMLPYHPSAQFSIPPTAVFDFSEKNYIAKTESSNRYCIPAEGGAEVSFDQGDTFSWDTSILSLTKNGLELDYTVTIDGVDYTNKPYVFDKSEEKTIRYSFSDMQNFCVDESGNISQYTVEYVKEITVRSIAVAPQAKHAQFTFGNTPAVEKTVGNKTYIMPGDDYTGAKKSTTIDNQSVICAMRGSESNPLSAVRVSGSNLYAYVTIFENLTITDYSDGGMGTKQTIGMNTTEKPKNLEFIAWRNKAYGTQNADTGFTTENNRLVYEQGNINNADRAAGYYLAEFKYTDNMGSAYYFIVGDYFGSYTKPSSSGCVAEGTLITLADGTQKPVEELTGNEELLVWDFDTASYASAPIVFIEPEPEAPYEIIRACFSDGTEVETTYEHGFFDYSRAKFIYINDDNPEQYIGDLFVMKDGDGWRTVELTSIERETKVTTVYGLTTYHHFNYFNNDMLSIEGNITGMFNYFEVDRDTMGYDQEKKQADIEKYGLLTYEDFEGIIDEFGFAAYNGQYLAVSVGKGLITWDGIKALADYYGHFTEGRVVNTQ